MQLTALQQQQQQQQQQLQLPQELPGHHARNNNSG
jgi:hypothetical protein